MRIPYISVDKYVATPYTPGLENTFPVSTAYYKLGIQVYEDDGTLPTRSVSVYLDDDQNRNRVQYWKDDRSTNITSDVLDGKPMATDVHGHLTVYVAVSNFDYAKYAGCIFNIFASPTPDALTDGVNQTLTCCYYTYDEALKVADKKLSPLTLPVGADSLVTIPPWSDFAYSLRASLNSLTPDANANAKISIVVNGKRVDGGSHTYQSLRSGVEIPYSLMIAGDRDNNCIVYIIGDGAGRSSIPWRFSISGIPLLMPAPTPGLYKAPWWTGAAAGQPPKTQPLTINDLMGTQDGNGFGVSLQFAGDVREGDIYRVFIYLNGYAADGTPHTRLLGDGSPIPGMPWRNILEITAPKGAKGGDTARVLAPIAACEGFLELDADDFGYLWITYQVNGRNWSNAYVGNKAPVTIDFGYLQTEQQGENR